MAVIDKPLTADELWRMPEPDDGTRYELLRGELIVMSPAGGRHGQVCLAIGSLLRAFVEANKLGTVTSNDTGVTLQRDPDTVLGPDMAYWRRQRLPEMPEGYVEVPPDLVVEVVSPSDAHGKVHEKVLEYLDHGVGLVWVVDPRTRTVTVYRSRQEVRILRDRETLSGEQVLPGFSCQVNDLFGDDSARPR